MMTSRPRLIADTNVLIDIYRGGIIEEFFRLPYEFVSADVIVEELEEPNGQELEGMGLLRAELDGGQVLEVEFLWDHNLDIAVNDILL